MMNRFPEMGGWNCRCYVSPMATNTIDMTISALLAAEKAEDFETCIWLRDDMMERITLPFEDMAAIRRGTEARDR